MKWVEEGKCLFFIRHISHHSSPRHAEGVDREERHQQNCSGAREHTHTQSGGSPTFPPDALAGQANPGASGTRRISGFLERFAKFRLRTCDVSRARTRHCRWSRAGSSSARQPVSVTRR